MNFFRVSCSDAEREYKANKKFSTFFQIDLKIIRMIRSKYLSLSFNKNISKFVIFRRDIGKVRSLCKFCRVGLNIQRVKTKLKFTRA